jgi:predicted CopG family antitoxin
MTKLKHITVNQEVYQKLKDLGKAGDSFNDVLTRILLSIDQQQGGVETKRC